MPSKLTPHIQTYTANVQSFLQQARPIGAKWMEFPQAGLEIVKQHGGINIGRIYFKGEPLDVDLVVDAIKHEAASSTGHLVDYWELLNEAHQNGESLTKLADFTLACINRLPNVRVLCGSFSEGNPSNFDDWPRFFDAMRAAQASGGGIALHEYDAPRMMQTTPWRCLRYRKAWELWPADLQDIQIFITETGIDGGVSHVGKPEHGWKKFVSEAEYVDDLRWYDAELRKDNGGGRPNVRLATLFTCGWYEPWESFDVSEARGVAAYIAGERSHTNPTAPPLPQPGAPSPVRGYQFELGFRLLADALRARGVDVGEPLHTEYPLVAEGEHIETIQRTTKGEMKWFKYIGGEWFNDSLFVATDKSIIAFHNGGNLRVV